MKTLRYGIVALLVAAAGVGITQTSEAMSIPAFLGQPQNPVDYTCFRNSFGTITNTCSVQKQYCVSLPVDSNGHIVQANVVAPDSSHNIGCFAQAVTRDLFDAGHTPSPVFPGILNGTSQIITLGTFNVPSFGALFACCNMQPGSQLQTLAY